MKRPYRVLTIDGGGLRGYYTAQYLKGITAEFSRRRGGEIDFGKAFDLIVGTSTGAIVGAGLASGVSLQEIGQLYREWGPRIFPLKVPSDLWGLIAQEVSGSRKRAVARGDKALQTALSGILGEKTLGELYEERGIGFAVTAVELGSQRGVVFKTPHLGGERDSSLKIVDALLATSAAPIYRSIANLPTEFGSKNETRAFVDGGLWANNPVLVGFIDALRATDLERPIDIYALGTCTPRSGEDIPAADAHRGLLEWRFGAEALTMSISAQEHVYDEMAQMLSRSFNSLGRNITVSRFLRRDIPTEFIKHMSIDDASDDAFRVYGRQAETDFNYFMSVCDNPDNSEGKRFAKLFCDAPMREK